jgi:hypothetical protein
MTLVDPIIAGWQPAMINYKKMKCRLVLKQQFKTYSNVMNIIHHWEKHMQSCSLRPNHEYQFYANEFEVYVEDASQVITLRLRDTTLFDRMVISTEERI